MMTSYLEKWIASCEVLYDAADIPVWLLDETFALVWSNKACREGLKMTKSPLEYLHATDRQLFAQRAQIGESFVCSLDFLQKEPIWVSVVPMKQQNTAAYLIETIKEEKIAQPSDVKVEQLVPGFLNQIREPMFNIFNIFSILTRSFEEKELYREIEYLKKATKNCYRILKESTNVSQLMKLQDAKYQPKVQIVDLDAFLSDMMQTVQFLLRDADKKQVSVEYLSQEKFTPVNINPEMLSIMVLNVLLNACMFSKPNGKVVVSLAIVGETAVITVKDDGEGIGAQALPHVFESMFGQAQEGQTLGIGLTVVQEICRKCGGTCMITANPDVGTTVSLRLPLSLEAPRKPMFRSNPSSYLSNKLSLVNIFLAEAFYSELQ